MDPLAYPWEKFSNALFSLAGEGSLQSRIYSAFSSFHTIQAKHFQDADLREQYESIMRRLTTVKDPDKGYVPATLDQMSDEEARQVITEILDLTLSIAAARLSRARPN